MDKRDNIPLISICTGSGLNQKYTDHIHIYGAIVLLKICSHNRTRSSSSSIRRIWWSLQ